MYELPPMRTKFSWSSSSLLQLDTFFFFAKLNQISNSAQVNVPTSLLQFRDLITASKKNYSYAKLDCLKITSNATIFRLKMLTNLFGFLSFAYLWLIKEIRTNSVSIRKLKFRQGTRLAQLVEQ